MRAAGGLCPLGSLWVVPNASQLGQCALQKSAAGAQKPNAGPSTQEGREGSLQSGLDMHAVEQVQFCAPSVMQQRHFSVPGQ